MTATSKKNLLHWIGLYICKTLLSSSKKKTGKERRTKLSVRGTNYVTFPFTIQIKPTYQNFCFNELQFHYIGQNDEIVRVLFQPLQNNLNCNLMWTVWWVWTGGLVTVATFCKRISLQCQTFLILASVSPRKANCNSNNNNNNHYHHHH